MITLYRDVEYGSVAPFDELYILNADEMIINHMKDGITNRQIRLIRLRDTRRIGTYYDRYTASDEDNVLIEDIELWIRTDLVEGMWEHVGIETRKVPENLIKKQQHAAFDAANVVGI